MGVRSRAAVLAAAIVLLVACQPAEIEETPTPDPAAIPSGSPAALGATATGPITELGSGVMAGLGWRLLAYPSASGRCVQLETAGSVQTECNGDVPDEGSAFGSVDRSGRVVHGIATADAATVWLVVNNTPAVPAVLMPLAEVGLEGAVAFVAVLPTGTEASHVMAVRMNGEVLGTRELP
jgi:hypothetical protein